jgi:tRNA pseudouridine55 synthase
MEYRKTYRAEIELGVATDSYDAEGSVTGRGETSGITMDMISTALDKFRGEIQQTPPIYSALKHEGQPLYKLARQGIPVEPGPRPATVYRLDLIAFNSPMLTLDVECSKGTYIRSLAHELGMALGCGAHLKGLIRTAYGPFDIKDAITLERLEEAAKDGSRPEQVQPMDTVLSLLQRVELSEEQVTSVRCGVGLKLDIPAETLRLRAYDAEGGFMALLHFDPETSLWRPQKVFHLLQG